MIDDELKREVIEQHISIVMAMLDIELNDDNAQTPKRITKMLVDELFVSLTKNVSELDSQMTLFKAPNNNPVVVKGIKFTSMCEHHWLPFTGYVDVEYIPSDNIIGLSKIPRVVKWFSKKPQVQERLTAEIGEYLERLLKPKHLKVILRDVRHSCVEARGVESECLTDTMYESKTSTPKDLTPKINLCHFHPQGRCPRTIGDCKDCRFISKN